MPMKMSIVPKLFSKNAALKIMDFSVKSFYVFLETIFKAKLFSENIALKIFDIVVNNFNVSLDVIFRF